MNTQEKAGEIFDAANKLATEYEAEGQPARALVVTNAFAGLPTESAARLYDILKAAN